MADLSNRELFALYLEETSRVDASASAAVSAHSEVAAAEAALAAAREALVSSVTGLSASVADLITVVDLGREAGILDPDPLRYLPYVPPASVPEPVYVAPAREHVRELENRTSPGYSKHAAYRACKPSFQSIAKIAGEIELSARVTTSALGDLFRVGLVRKQKHGAEVEYALIDREHLPLTPAQMASFSGLARTEAGQAQLEELIASLRSARAASEAVTEKQRPKPKAKAKPVPAPAPTLAVADASPDHPAITVVPDPPPVVNRKSLLEPRPLPGWRPGDHVRAYDAEMRQWQPGTVERILTRGKHRGELIVRVTVGHTRRGGNARTIQVSPDKVKRAESA